LVQVVNSSWAALGQVVFIASGGYYSVFGIPDGTHLNLTNLGYTGNAAPTTVIASPQNVSPGGLVGPTGPSGAVTLNAISPTTTKGDLIVDNGANNPAASDVRLGVGTNGQLLAADSTQATGIAYKSVLPNAAATDGDIVIFSGTTGTPMAVKDSLLLISATGAIQSTPSGGNARGTSAIDLQVVRGANTEVASGNDSVISGGQSNTASALNSTVGGGTTNAASAITSTISGGSNNATSGQQSSIGGGDSNTASNTGSTVGGGTGNTASGSRSTVAGGSGNTANALDSTCGGGVTNTVSGSSSTIAGGSTNSTSGNFCTVPGGEQAAAVNFGQMAHASGQFAAPGDAQTSELIWRILTTDATAGVEMFLDGAAQRAVLALNTSWAFVVRLIGRSSAGVCAVFETKGGIQNVAGTVTLIAANTQTVIVDGTGSTWGVTANVAITADNANKSLKVAVTGAVGTNIRWVAHARLVEVNF
jgi:hypothetical protein